MFYGFVKDCQSVGCSPTASGQFVVMPMFDKLLLTHATADHQGQVYDVAAIIPESCSLCPIIHWGFSEYLCAYFII